MEDEKKPAEMNTSEETEKPAELPAPEEQARLEAPAEPAKPEPAENDEAVKAEAAAQADEASISAKEAAIDEMEKATQKALDAMREKDNPENEKVVDEATDHLEKLFDEFSKWMKENTQPERIRAEFGVFQNSVRDLLEKTRQNVIEVSQNEKFRETMESGRDFVVGTAGLIGDGLKYGYDKLLEIPEFKKAADAIGEKVDELRSSETLKNAVDRSEEGLSSLGAAIFSSIRSFFNTPDHTDPEEKDLPDLPEDPHTPAGE